MPRPMQHPRQAPRGTACNVACGTLLPLSTSRKHVPVTVGRRCICDLATKLLSAAGASASRRARRGRVSAADAGVPRAAQPERAGRAFILATNAACEPASQRASREAMLLPGGTAPR